MCFNRPNLSAFLRPKMFFGSFLLFAFLMLTFVNNLQAQNNLPINDGHGKVWFQINNTPRQSWNQIAQNCPQDGVTPCSGAFNEWVWASDTQVLQLFSYHESAMATNRSVGGMPYFVTAQNFLSVFQPTFSFCGTYQCGAYGAGWTSTKDANNLPIFGAVSWGNTNVSIDGSFGVGPDSSADNIDSFRGIWLWRATGPGIFAYDDSGQIANPSGGTAVANVLANDWIAGVRATTSNVFMSQTASSNSGVSLDIIDGSVDVAAGTPAGTYTLNYQICDSTNASNCDGANVTVAVNQYIVDAVNDAGWASPSTGGIAVANVLANDRLSTFQATTANVGLSLVSAPSGVSLNTTTGAVNVAAGTAFGDYALVYKICDKTNLANCDQATASVSVRNYVIDAVNDYVRASSKVAGTPLNVLTNDIFNGTTATTAKVQISQISATIPGITLNTSTGWISVAAKTSSGIYNLTYKICEINAPTNCDTAIATIELSGRGN